MGFFGRFFGGRSQRNGDSSAASERVAAVVADMKSRAMPCLRLVAGEGGRSRLGGSPEMESVWPRCAGYPLSLVAQLDLAEIRAAGGPDWLPSEGRLMFFYLADGGGWGFDPKDAGSFLVLHETESAAPAPYPGDLEKNWRFDAHPIEFVARESMPGEERLGDATASFTGVEDRILEATLDALALPGPAHQIGGFPEPIQGDHMELECQLVTHGIYCGSSEGYQSKEAESLKAGAADWRLLLQVDTDDDAQMMWGDTGRLYFWIREQDARAADFSKAWMILQCY